MSDCTDEHSLNFQRGGRQETAAQVWRYRVGSYQKEPAWLDFTRYC